MRRVASAKGVEYYGQPLGTPITADLLERARKKNGGKAAPKGATKTYRANSPALVSKKPKPLFQAAAAPAAPKAVKAPPLPPVRIVKDSVSGPKGFKLGKNTHTLPAGSRLFKPAGGENARLAITPDGNVHAYNEDGEVALDSQTEARVKGLLVSDKGGVTDVTGDLGEPDEEPEAKPEEKAPKAPPAPKPEDRTPPKEEAPPAKPKTVKTHTTTSRSARIAAGGGETPPLHELDSSEASNFHKASGTKEHTPEDLAKMKLLTTDDGKSGIAVKNGNEITAHFSENKNLNRHLISTAVDNGGTHLSTDDQDFAKDAASEGFKSVARVTNDGKPDTHYMAYDRGSVDSTFDPKGGNEVATHASGMTAARKAAAAAKPRFKRDPKSMGDANRRAPDPKEIAALKQSPYSSAHVDENGEFTPERKKLHEKIINDFLEGLEPVENPTQFMNGGGPASGKGSMTKGANAKLTNYPTSRGVDDHTGDLEKVDKPGALLIDPDAIKMQLPEVKEALKRLNSGDVNKQDQGWAGHSHEESSQLAKQLHRAALDRGYNVIYDGTGNSSADSVRAKVKAAKEAGYRIEANYLYLDPTEGIARAKSRADRTHRIVPEEQIRATYAHLPAIFDELKDDGTFDKVNLFNNSGPAGSAAALVGSGDGKNFNVALPKDFDEYLKSGETAWNGYVAPNTDTKAKQEKLQETDSSKKAAAGGITKGV